MDKKPGTVRLYLPAGIDHKVVREIAGLTFVECSENVILQDPSGVGETHLAVTLGVKVADAGYRALFMPLDKLITMLIKVIQENWQKAAIIIDYKRVGWTMSISPDSRFTMKALEMSWETRGKPTEVMFHSE